MAGRIQAHRHHIWNIHDQTCMSAIHLSLYHHQVMIISCSSSLATAPILYNAMTRLYDIVIFSHNRIQDRVGCLTHTLRPAELQDQTCSLLDTNHAQTHRHDYKKICICHKMIHEKDRYNARIFWAPFRKDCDEDFKMSCWRRKTLEYGARMWMSKNMIKIGEEIDVSLKKT